MLKNQILKTSRIFSLIIVLIFSMTGTAFGKANTKATLPLYD